jgi:hypothetical protein
LKNRPNHPNFPWFSILSHIVLVISTFQKRYFLIIFLAMKQRLLQITKWLAFSFTFFFLVLLIIAQVYEDRIGVLVVESLNKSLKKPLIVETVDLTLIRTFPKASIVLTNVEIPDAKKGTLLKTRTMALQFGILSVFQDVIDVQSVTVSNGSLNIQTDKKGNTNYNIFLPTEKKEDSEEMDIRLSVKNASLNDIHLIYENNQFKQSGIVHIEKLTLSGNFSTGKFDLRSTAELEVEYLTTKEGDLLSGRTLAYETAVKVDLDKGEYILNNTNLYIDANKFTVNGRVKNGRDYTDFDVSLNGVDGSLYSVISLLPKEQISGLEDFDTRGKFYIKSNIKGRLSDENLPAIDLEFGLKDGYLNSDRLKNELKNVSFEVLFQNKAKSPDKKAFLRMTKFEGELLDEKLTASLFVQDFSNPLIDLRFEGKIPMEAASGFLGTDFVKSGSGTIDFKQIIIEGYYNDMLSMTRIPNIQANGLIAFEDMSLDVKGEKLSLAKGEIFINNNNLQINNIDLEVAQNDLKFKGSFKNLLPVILRDSTTSEDVKLVFDTEMSSEKIDLDKLLAFIEKAQGEPEPKVDLKPGAEILVEKGNVAASPYYEFLKLFDGKFKMKVGNFKYDNIKAQDCSGNLTVENGRILLQNANIKDLEYGKVIAKDFTGDLAFQGKMMILKDVSVETMGGNIKLTSNVFLEDETYIDGFVQCQGLNGQMLFEQMDDFGQDVLTSKNIRGVLDAKIKLKAYLDKDGNVLYDKLYFLSDFTINNGALIDFKMLEDFSSFVKVDDLKNIKFSNTRNQLEFKDRRLTIPAMFIQNNAVNLTIAGWQGYDLDFDYVIKVNAGQTVANKFKRFNPKRKAIKAKKDGWFNIYVHLFGDVDKYEFEYDKKVVEDRLEANTNAKFRQIENDIAIEFKENPLRQPEDWENSPEDIN